MNQTPTGDPIEVTKPGCPNCGYCPHCGRQGNYPYVPAPQYPYWGPWTTSPTWIYPTVTGGSTITTGTGTITFTNNDLVSRST